MTFRYSPRPWRLGAAAAACGSGGANDSEKEEQSSHLCHPRALRARSFCDTIRPMHKQAALVLVAFAIGPPRRRTPPRTDRRPHVPPAGRVSATHIAFVYAGDIWVVPKQGGVAQRLSSPRGEEEFPRFSPDGSRIAFSANYDGNTDVYVVPALGGDPVRLTTHPMDDRVVGWHPDGKRILFVSSRGERPPALQPVLPGAVDRRPAGEAGGPVRRVRRVLARTATQFAYMPQSQDFRTWKRYRGGWAPDIWLFDTKTLAVEERHAERRGGRAADVARLDDLLHVGPRRRDSARTSGPTTRRRARRAR